MWHPASALAMRLCQERAGLTLAEIGLLFGGVHYSAVSQAIRRLRVQLEEGRGDLHEVKSVLLKFDQ